MTRKPKLIVLDLDNTLVDWIYYFHKAVKRSIETASEITGIPYTQLCEEYKQFLDHEDSIECPFVIQQLPSILNYYNYDFNRILTECAEPARAQFKLTAYPYLKPYTSVLKTMQKLSELEDTKLVVLTDAPLQIALHRLNKMGILHYFDGVYGAESPKLPTVRGKVAVTEEILLKYLDGWHYGFIGRRRELPNDYRKPDVRGLKNILLDFGLENFEQGDILFAGDNVYKDVAAANKMGITSIHCAYGIKIDPTCLAGLREFVPERFIHKGIDLSATDYPKPVHTIQDFSEILGLIE